MLSRVLGGCQAKLRGGEGKLTNFDLELFYQTASRIRERALRENRLTENPSDEELRSILEKEPGIKRTVYANFVAESEPTSRSAMFTKNSVDHRFGAAEMKLLRQCEEALGGLLGG